MGTQFHLRQTVSMMVGGGIYPALGVTEVGLSALFSTVSAINATLFSSALYAKRMLADGLLPDQFGDEDASGPPSRTVVLVGALTILFSIWGSLEGITSFASLSFIVVFGAMNYLAVRDRRRLAINGAVPAVGLVGSAVFLPLMVYHLYADQRAVFHSVVLIAAAGLAVELLYFKRRSIMEGLRTIERGV